MNLTTDIDAAATRAAERAERRKAEGFKRYGELLRAGPASTPDFADQVLAAGEAIGLSVADVKAHAAAVAEIATLTDLHARRDELARERDAKGEIFGRAIDNHGAELRRVEKALSDARDASELAARKLQEAVTAGERLNALRGALPFLFPDDDVAAKPSQSSLLSDALPKSSPSLQALKLNSVAIVTAADLPALGLSVESLRRAELPTVPKQADAWFGGAVSSWAREVRSILRRRRRAILVAEVIDLPESLDELPDKQWFALNQIGWFPLDRWRIAQEFVPHVEGKVLGAELKRWHADRLKRNERTREEIAAIDAEEEQDAATGPTVVEVSPATAAVAAEAPPVVPKPAKKSNRK